MATKRGPAWFIVLTHWAAWVTVAEVSVYVLRISRGDTYEISDSIIGMFLVGSLCGLLTGGLAVLVRMIAGQRS